MEGVPVLEVDRTFCSPDNAFVTLSFHCIWLSASPMRLTAYSRLYAVMEVDTTLALFYVDTRTEHKVVSTFITAYKRE